MTPSVQHPQGTRDDLAGTIAAPNAAEVSRIAHLLQQCQRMDARQIAGWLKQWSDGKQGQGLDDAEAAGLVARIQDIHVRDAAWGHLLR